MVIPSPPTPSNIERAADIIRDGGLVIMPTETVYGIAADATNAEAIKKIYSAKDRPSENPLIIHISDFVQLDDVVGEWNNCADLLANRFWPGPLTLILKKSDLIPDEATGGLDTAAVRMPSHQVALELIEVADVPLVAPSANRFMRLSPTRAENVDPELAAKVDMILDGGPCQVGLESTVVDVTVDPPRILRPGGVSRGEIEAALGMSLGQVPPGSARKSPGLYPRHYAPKATVRIVRELSAKSAGLGFSEPQNEQQSKMPQHPAAYAAILYDALHRADTFGPQTIEIEAPPEAPEWEAVWDRLRKASA